MQHINYYYYAEQLLLHANIECKYFATSGVVVINLRWNQTVLRRNIVAYMRTFIHYYIALTSVTRRVVKNGHSTYKSIRIRNYHIAISDAVEYVWLNEISKFSGQYAASVTLNIIKIITYTGKYRMCDKRIDHCIIERFKNTLTIVKDKMSRGWRTTDRNLKRLNTILSKMINIPKSYVLYYYNYATRVHCARLFMLLIHV